MPDISVDRAEVSHDVTSASSWLERANHSPETRIGSKLNSVIFPVEISWKEGFLAFIV